MQDVCFRRIALLSVAVALVVEWLGLRAVRADEDLPPPRVASAALTRDPGSASARPFPPRGALVRRGDPESESEATATRGWWLGTTGIVLALAAFGAISVAARRGWRWPQAQASGMFRVVGRTSLSPRHAVYLLRVGDRVLIVGTGPQSAPSLLGELTDRDEFEPPAPSREPGSQPKSVVVIGRRPGGDAR
jgi:flagellar biogenesis protein FliO